MTSVTETIMKAIKENTYCYAKGGGTGHVPNEECSCYSKKEYCCQAFLDSKRFHEHFVHLCNYQDLIAHRDEVIEEIKDEFADSQWFKDNVIV